MINPGSATRPSLLEEVRSRRKLRIAVEFGDPPGSGSPPEMYIDPITKKPAGIAPILGQLMADDLGVELECVDMLWPEQVPALVEGRVDVLTKHTNIPSRALLVEFANRPLVAFRIAVLVPSGNRLTKADLNSADKTISVWHGSSTRVNAEREFPSATIREFPDPQAEVSAGRADACVTDAITHVFLEKHPELELLSAKGQAVVLATEYSHIAIRPGDQRFLNWINSWLAYQDGLGTLSYWCDVWWESFMAVGAPVQTTPSAGSEIAAGSATRR